MKRFSSRIISEFTSNDNKDRLLDILNRHFHNRAAYKYLDANFDTTVYHFANKIEIELSMSDPMPGTTMQDHLTDFNHQFIKSSIEFIDKYIISDEPIMYKVHDGVADRPVSTAHANTLLDSWRHNSTRGSQAREDPSGDVYFRPDYSHGITFCDQRELGVQQHYEQFYNSAMSLNNGHLAHEETVFGVSTPAADARLASRRIFRGNEQGQENGVPRYESRLYNRNIDRDITEGLRGSEKDYISYGHDMSSLYKRVDYKDSRANPCNL